ncbi:N-acetylmuramoyl-L-alanine amidase family protein [Dethiosulfovibrio salsuginis]|uniref:N-acetylmuramoyl-L-alanine amidase n=1 Tax=Dethiosulfovibrio salsuginis TaxID=561720 RepID=A0A1X7JMS9_9BACT|nr:N-acetylmuramoyl-L-alanine amidase [Dethiosulfovibrio salsuginis]SMG29185.1 N-acetylmuramoyl-L-alanine amidase [Dethiosulfovibrio salsuginis]
MRIAIDPGHGGKDPGAVGGQLRESEVALAISLFLRDELVDGGHSVLMTRETDVFITIGDRCRLANTWKADLFLSIHCNAASSPQAHGMELLIFPGSARGRDLAGHIWGALRDIPGLRDRGIKPRGDLGVLRGTSMPAVLVEAAFISNPENRRDHLETTHGRRRIAKAIAQGVMEWV